MLQPDALVAWEMEATEKVPLCRLKDELFVKLADIRPNNERLPDDVNVLIVDVKDVVLIAFGVIVEPIVTDPQLRVPLPLTVPELLLFASASTAVASDGSAGEGTLENTTDARARSTQNASTVVFAQQSSFLFGRKKAPHPIAATNKNIHHFILQK